MSQLLNNPNVKKKNKFQRKEQLKPESSFNINDLEDTKKNSRNISSVTFDTTVRINNHLKNFLKSMTILGMAQNQQTALKILEDTWIEQLTDSERQTLKQQISTLEKSDALNSQNK